MAEKIGNLIDIIKPNLYKYVLMGAFENVMLGGISTYKDIQEDFKINIDNGINMIMLQTIDKNKFKIDLSKKIEGKNGNVGMSITKSTFIIHYDKPNFPIYDSEY